ncbi:hypothetical protein [Brachybacterium sp. EE-P12]|uniref:hypothetical protein n=1 Tax=Brachybacterium sp. EE-P12 TaxID=2306299 RepID=UPI000F0865FC|nr:hypothetical protein [Brachybacterium sp. EE-P12]
MKRTIRLLAAPATALLLLSACGSADEPSNATPTEAEENVDSQAEAADESDSWPIVEDEDGNVVENPEDESGAFSLTDEPFFASTVTGAQITMTMDAQPDASEEIAWLEQYREDAGGEPVSYILSDVDNRDGSEPINMYNISVYDEEGLEWACGSPDEYLDEVWRPEWLYISTDEDEYESADGEPMDYDVAKELDDRASEHEYVHGVSPFERATMVSICAAELPETAMAVEVMPQGIMQDPIYATPESYMGEDG